MIKNVDELLLQIEDQAKEIQDLKKKNTDLMSKMVNKSKEVDTLKRSVNDTSKGSRSPSPFTSRDDKNGGVFGFSPF